jgi:hypothetical protein
MKMLVGVAALLGAMATGGVPAAMMAVGQDQVPEVDPVEAVEVIEAATNDTADAAGPKNSVRPDKAAGGGQDTDEAPDRDADEAPDPDTDENGDGEGASGPPAHAQSAREAAQARSGSHGQEMSAPGRAHAKAMQAWAGCVSGYPNKADGFDPEEACGLKPVPPGHQKHRHDAEEPPGDDR